MLHREFAINCGQAFDRTVLCAGSLYWAKIMEQKQFMRMVQVYREKNNGRFPPEPGRVKLKRMLRCGASMYTPEHIAYVAGLRARKVSVGPWLQCDATYPSGSFPRRT